MKLRLITLIAACAAALAFIPLAQAQAPAEAGGEGGHGGHGRHGFHHDGGNRLQHMTKNLNLTPDQQAKVQPIIDKAAPQIAAIHQEAMQKSKMVMDSVVAQIRPLLTPEQQTQLDARQERHRNHEAKREAKNE